MRGQGVGGEEGRRRERGRWARGGDGSGERMKVERKGRDGGGRQRGGAREEGAGEAARHALWKVGRKERGLSRWGWKAQVFFFSPCHGPTAIVKLSHPTLLSFGAHAIFIFILGAHAQCFLPPALPLLFATLENYNSLSLRPTKTPRCATC